MKWKIFRLRFVLIPISIPLFEDENKNGRYRYRELLIFGVRVAYWTVQEVTMKVELLQLVKEQILREPAQFDMDRWFSTGLQRFVPNCGTAACIGGWALAINRGVSPRQADSMHVSYDPVGKQIVLDPYQILGLSLAEGSRLFHVMAWPMKFKSAFRQEEDNTLEGLQARARIAAARIDHFIATNGRE